MSSMTSSGARVATIERARRPSLTARTPYPASRRIPASSVRLFGLSSTMKTSPLRMRLSSAGVRSGTLEQVDDFLDAKLTNGAREFPGERLVVLANPLDDEQRLLVVARAER